MSPRSVCDRLRDILAAVDKAMLFVWGTVDVDLPPLRAAATAELEQLDC